MPILFFALFFTYFAVNYRSASANDGNEIFFESSDFKLLLRVMKFQESTNRTWIINKKEGAYGCLQVRKKCLQDINNFYGTNYNLTDFLGNEKLSVWALKGYVSMYSKKLGIPLSCEFVARLWNGGPSGWRSQGAEKYWQKLSANIKKLKLELVQK